MNDRRGLLPSGHSAIVAASGFEAPGSPPVRHDRRRRRSSPKREEFLRAVDATSADKPLVFKLSEPGSARPRNVTISLRDLDIPQ
jgi:hypothetical protein